MPPPPPPSLDMGSLSLPFVSLSCNLHSALYKFFILPLAWLPSKKLKACNNNHHLGCTMHFFYDAHILYYICICSFDNLVKCWLRLAGFFAHSKVLQKSQYWIRHDGLFKVNIATAACCLFALAVLSFNMAKQYILCRSFTKSGEKIW